MDYVAIGDIERRRSLAEALSRQDDLHRSAPSPLYGLPPSFEVPRMTGESQWAPRVEVELAHGGDFAAADQPSLRVVVVHEDRVDLDAELTDLLWKELRPAPPARLDEGKLREWLRPPSPEQRATWQKGTATVVIEGASHEFAVLDAGDLQVAGLDCGGHAVILKARRWPLDGLELVRITDVEPYVEGWHRFLEQKAAGS